MEDGIVIRFYRDGDEEAINVLFNQVYQMDRTPDYWRWKYLASPAAVPAIISIAEVDGRVVGAYTGITVRFKVAERVVIAAQVTDLCILPEYRRASTLMRLFRHPHPRMQKIPTGFGFGFPNEVAYGINRRLLGLSELCRMPILTKRLNLRLAVKNRIRIRFLERFARWWSNWAYRLWNEFGGLHLPEGVRIEKVDSFDDAFDAFWERVSKNYSILGVRDRTYLNWRYGQNPHGGFFVLRAWRGEAMEGYLIAKVVDAAWGERPSYVFDLLTMQDHDVTRALLRQAISAALKSRADNIKIAVLRHHPLYDIARKQGFREKGESKPVTYAIYDRSLDEQYIANASRWFLSYGDTDLLG